MISLSENANNNKTLKLALLNLLKLLGLNVSSEVKWCVHHINGDDQDQSIDNLCLIPLSRHSAYHNSFRAAWRKDPSLDPRTFLKSYCGEDVLFIGEELSKVITAITNAKEGDKV